jgi:7-carboxy-7-deazaguanine synthase
MHHDATRERPVAHRLADSPAGPRRYAVKSIWRTLQGEGAWAGRPAVFARLAACNLWSGYEIDRRRDAERSGAHCPLWCDTDFTREGAARLAAHDLADEIARIAGPDLRFVVLTGGEPLLQADSALIAALHERGFEVACETNGTVSLAEAFATAGGGVLAPDWIVCSPKLPQDRLVLEWCDELKLVVPDYQPAAYAAFAGRVREHPLAGRPRRFLWLQPEDGPRQAEATRLAVALAQEDPRWRVSVQTHKIIGVD